MEDHICNLPSGQQALLYVHLQEGYLEDGNTKDLYNLHSTLLYIPGLCVCLINEVFLSMVHQAKRKKQALISDHIKTRCYM